MLLRARSSAVVSAVAATRSRATPAMAAAAAAAASAVPGLQQSRRGVYGGGGGGGGAGGAGTAARSSPRKAVSLGSLAADAAAGRRLTMVTGYNAWQAQLVAESGVDLLLVGDSVAMVEHGLAGTTGATLDEMVAHTATVRRGVEARERGRGRKPLVVGDLPFGSYTTPEKALEASVRLLKEGRADVVKLEGGQRVTPQVEALTAAGIAVMGHVGLTPQTAVAQGGLRPQAVTPEAVEEIIADARALEEAGCFAIVLEFVPTAVAEAVTRAVSVPTIGIGSGPVTTGQVLVFHDLLGIYRRAPRFSKQYAQLNAVAARGLAAYRDDVLAGRFPSAEHEVNLDPAAARAIDDTLAARAAERPSPRASGAASAEISTQPAASRPSSTRQLRGAATAAEAAAREARRVVVVGGGALGSLFAARTSQGADDMHVALVSRRAEALRRAGGLRIVAAARSGLERPGEVTEASGVAVHDSVDDALAGMPQRAADVVVLAHKQSSGAECRSAGQAAAAVLRANPDAVVMALQNGPLRAETFDHDEGALLRRRTAHGVTMAAAIVDSPGRVRDTNARAVTTLYDVEPDSAESPAEILVSFFNERFTPPAGATAEFRQAESPAEGARRLWEKIGINAVVNPITALTGVKNGALSADQDEASSSSSSPLRGLVASLCQELEPVIDERAPAIEGSEPVPESGWLAQRVHNATRATAANTSSMLSDVQAGRRTEAASILGPLMSAAREGAHQTPVLNTLRQLVDALDAEQAVAASDREAAEPAAGMRVARTARDVRRQLAAVAGSPQHPKKSVGFVPTMGALHEGHMELVRRAQEECDLVVVSIFVNPTQFDATEDLASYPRTLERDLELLRQAGVDLAFVPEDPSDVYRPGHATFVDLASMPLGSSGEAAQRPDFFRGVATVCSKLFNIVRPDAVFFGQKDAQQCAVVRQLVDDLDFDIDVNVVPTAREADGLALSSRNARLDAEQRARAPALYRALSDAADGWRRGNVSADATVGDVRAALERSLAAIPHAEVEYVLMTHPHTAAPLDDAAPLPRHAEGERACIAAALRLDPAPDAAPTSQTVRLLDNVMV